VRQRLFGSSIVGLVAGIACASTFDGWFAEFYYGHPVGAIQGIDTVWGKALLLLGAMGIVVGFASVAAPRFRIVDVALSLAAIAVVVTAGTTHQASEEANEWLATNSFWAALAVAISWAVVATVSVVPFLRNLAARLAAWLFAPDTRSPAMRVSTAFVAGSIGAICLFIGAIGPWRADIVTRSGIAETQDGVAVLLCAFLSMLGLLQYWRLGSRRAVSGIFLLAVVAATVAIIDLDDLSDRGVGSGWGINLGAAAAVTLALAALGLLPRRPSLIGPDSVGEAGPTTAGPPSSVTSPAPPPHAPGMS
jgi:hypothetical protein